MSTVTLNSVVKLNDSTNDSPVLVGLLVDITIVNDDSSQERNYKTTLPASAIDDLENSIKAWSDQRLVDFDNDCPPNITQEELDTSALSIPGVSVPVKIKPSPPAPIDTTPSDP